MHSGRLRELRFDIADYRLERIQFVLPGRGLQRLDDRFELLGHRPLGQDRLTTLALVTLAHGLPPKRGNCSHALVFSVQGREFPLDRRAGQSRNIVITAI